MSRRTRQRIATAALEDSPGFLLGRALPDDSEPIGFAPSRPKARAGAPPPLIHYAGDGPLMTIAATGAGKSSGPVITNLLLHPGQALCIDIKGELHRVTARRRSAFGPVHVLDLRDYGGLPGSLNPLHIARAMGSEMAVVARSLTATLIQRTGKEKERFWDDSAESLMTGAIVHAAWKQG